MKLEDVNLQSGDKITFNDGYIDFISSYNIDGADGLIDVYTAGRIKDIIKIERYEKYLQSVDNDEWLYSLKTIYEKTELLTDEEKEYLSDVIRPFRNEVLSITKVRAALKKYCFIQIKMSDGIWEINLPYFEKDKMYLSMEEDKEYTLKELEL